LKQGEVEADLKKGLGWGEVESYKVWSSLGISGEGGEEDVSLVGRPDRRREGSTVDGGVRRSRGKRSRRDESSSG
jgi:hypothetical protein